MWRAATGQCVRRRQLPVVMVNCIWCQRKFENSESAPSKEDKPSSSPRRWWCIAAGCGNLFMLSSKWWHYTKLLVSFHTSEFVPPAVICYLWPFECIRPKEAVPKNLANWLHTTISKRIAVSKKSKHFPAWKVTPKAFLTSPSVWSKTGLLPLLKRNQMTFWAFVNRFPLFVWVFNGVVVSLFLS